MNVIRNSRNRNRKKVHGYVVLWTGVTCVAVLVFFVASIRQQPPPLTHQQPPQPLLHVPKPKENCEMKAGSYEKISPVIVPNTCNSDSRGYFDAIYETGYWGAELRKPEDFYTNAEWPTPETRKHSASGLGSDLGSTTVTSLKMIRNTIHKFGIKSMVDVPCGDVNWMFESYETDTLPLYLGLDVTSKVIDINNERFDHHNNKEFRFWDMTECVLPKFYNKTSGIEQPFDLVHVRDVIQHLSLEQGVNYFCNTFRSGAKVLITTTYPSAEANKNIEVEGGWYENNLELEPFSFPKSEDCELSHPEVEPDSTCVYDLTEGTWVQEFISNKC